MKKFFIKILSNIFPLYFTEIAINKLTNPQIRKLRSHELITLNKANTENFIFKNFIIKTYTWGEGNNEILLIHGWEGQAGNFSFLIDELLKAGYKIRAFDGPSHGFSTKGSTSLMEFTELVGVLIRKYKAKNLISHSFGGVATCYALFNNLDLEVEKYALLTTPDKFIERIEQVARQIGISNKVKNLIIENLEQEYQLKVENLNVSDFVKVIKVQESFIMHDKDDKVIPIEQSMNVHDNWEVCSIEIIEGTGHFRILRTERVINKIVNFFNA